MLCVCVCMGEFIVMDREAMAALRDEVMKAESCVAFSCDAGSH